MNAVLQLQPGGTRRFTTRQKRLTLRVMCGSKPATSQAGRGTGSHGRAWVCSESGLQVTCSRTSCSMSRPRSRPFADPETKEDRRREGARLSAGAASSASNCGPASRRLLSDSVRPSSAAARVALGSRVGPPCHKQLCSSPSLHCVNDL